MKERCVFFGGALFFSKKQGRMRVCSLDTYAFVFVSVFLPYAYFHIAPIKLVILALCPPIAQVAILVFAIPPALAGIAPSLVAT